MSRPLQGLRVVVTRPTEKADNLSALLRDRGARVIQLPTISIEDPSSWADVDAALRKLSAGRYEWVVFTSVNAVEKVVSRLESAAHLQRAKIAAVGQVTADALSRHDIEVALVPREFTGEALAADLGPGSGVVLLPRVENAPRTTVDALKERGWTVEEITTYRNIALEPSAVPKLPPDAFDLVTFASGSAARNFAALRDVTDLGLAPGGHADKVVACIGPKTAEEASAAGLRVDLIAQVHTDEGLVSALEDYFAAR